MQQALPLVWQDRYRLDDFIRAPCNEQALQAMQHPENWKAPVLLLVGPQASGKTHLAYVFKDLHQAEFVDVDGGIPNAPFLVIEDVDHVLSRQPEKTEFLFHLVNDVMLRNSRLLLTAHTLAAAWVTLPDLLSRLQAAQLIVLEQPNEEMIKASYQKLFIDRGLFVDDKVLDYVSLRSQRSFADIRQNVDKLDKIALEKSRKITIPLIQESGLFTS